MNMTLGGVLFDKDGTLIDFHQTWLPAYQSAASLVADWGDEAVDVRRLLVAGGFNAQSGRFDPGSVLACGSGREIAQLWADMVCQPLERVRRCIEAEFGRVAADAPVAAVDLPVLLTALRDRGLQLGVATMDSEALAHQTLATLGVRDSFDFVCGYDSGYGEKPGPGMVEAFCASTGLCTAQVMVVGDTSHDMCMGRAAGVAYNVGVLTGASTVEDLKPFADTVLNDIGELITLLESGLRQ